MRDLARDGMTMMVVTHEMQFAREVGDRVDLHGRGAHRRAGDPCRRARPPQRGANADGSCAARSSSRTRSRNCQSQTRKEQVNEEDPPGDRSDALVLAVVAATIGSAQPRRPQPGLAVVEAAARGSAQAAGRHRAPQAAHRRRQVRHAAVRLPRRARQERRRRRRDREVVRPLRVRPRAAARVRLRTDRASASRCSPTVGSTSSSRRSRTRPTATRGSTSRGRTTRRRGRLLVKNNSPITTLNDIRGRRVATTSGSVYDRWMRRCFPTAEVVVTDSVTNAVLAFNQGRADAVMFDDTSLALIAASRPVRRR